MSTTVNAISINAISISAISISAISVSAISVSAISGMVSTPLLKPTEPAEAVYTRAPPNTP
jgi:hypothetical protein